MAPPRPNREEAEQIAFALGAPSVDVAFVRARQAIYYARRAPWLSPVLRLVRGVHELEPQRARWILRNRIFASAPAGPACAGAVRLAGRQLSAAVAAIDRGIPLPVPVVDAGAANPLPRRCRPELEPALAARVAEAPRRTPTVELARLAVALGAEAARAASGRGRADPPIAALLASGAGELLGFATSTGSRNPTAHAEANLVGHWLDRTGGPLPAGASVVVTLKPCKMCAGLLWEAAADPWSLRVFYVDHDPRRYARETVFDAGSMARRGVAGTQGQLTTALQFQVHISGRP